MKKEEMAELEESGNPMRGPSEFLTNLVERVSFGKIFVTWFLLILAFSFGYMVISMASPDNFLQANYGPTGKFRLSDPMDFVYYSFITATSTGYGDITPKGDITRFMAISEVIISLLMLAMVTSKLLSIKQEKLLEQIFHLSFSEKMNRIVSNFHLFRNEIETFIYSIEKGDVDRNKMFAFSILVTSLKSNMVDVHKIFFQNHAAYGKLSRKLEKHQYDHLLAGINQSFGKLNDVLSNIKGNDLVTKRESVLEQIYQLTNTAEEILFEIRKEQPIYSQKIDDTMMTLKVIRANIVGFRIENKRRSASLERQEILLPEKIVAVDE